MKLQKLRRGSQSMRRAQCEKITGICARLTYRSICHKFRNHFATSQTTTKRSGSTSECSDGTSKATIHRLKYASIAHSTTDVTHCWKTMTQLENLRRSTLLKPSTSTKSSNSKSLGTARYQSRLDWPLASCLSFKRKLSWQSDAFLSTSSMKRVSSEVGCRI